MAQPQVIRIDLGLTRLHGIGQNQTAQLELETSKHYGGGLSSDATLYWIAPQSKSRALGLGGGGDFSRCVNVNRSARAKQKAIDAQHAQTFTPDKVAELTAAALAHYNKYAKERARRRAP